MVKIGSFIGSGTINFDLKPQRKCVNKHFLGQENCNIMSDSGEILPLEHDNMNKVVESQNNLCSNYFLNVEADLLDNGELVNFRIIRKDV
jgi:hypothetical protein